MVCFRVFPLVRLAHLVSTFWLYDGERCCVVNGLAAAASPYSTMRARRSSGVRRGRCRAPVSSHHAGAWDWMQVYADHPADHMCGARCGARTSLVKGDDDSSDIGALAAPVSHGYIESNDFPCPYVAPQSAMFGMRYRRPIKSALLHVISFYNFVATFNV